jgi:hypothetical protein
MRCLNAKLDSLAAIIEKFCEPQVSHCSLTITEKGYIDPATGKLDLTQPRIATIYRNTANRIPHQAFWLKRSPVDVSAACPPLRCCLATIFRIMVTS